MALFKKKQTAPAQQAEAAPQNISMASGRLAPIFQRMYLWIVSVNLNYNVYQVESGAVTFDGAVIPAHGQYSALTEQLTAAALETEREKLQGTLSAQALIRAFASGRSNISTAICYTQGDGIRCMELRVERIPDAKANNFAALIYARSLQNEDDRGEIWQKQAPVAQDADGGIDWAAVRAQKFFGNSSPRYEYHIETDRFFLHTGSVENEKTVCWERFLASLESRSDYLVSHSSITPLRKLLTDGMAGREGTAEISIRAGGLRNAPFRHYKMNTAPLETTDTPTWLFGVLTDDEEDYRNRTHLQEIAIEMGTLFDQVFIGLYFVNTDKDTICSLVKTEGGYRPGEYVHVFSEYVTQRIESGIIAPESVENARRLIQKGFLERVAGKKSFEMDFRLKLPGSLDYAWYVDTFTPVQGKPHHYMISRRDITAIYAAKEQEYAYAESLRMQEYNQSMLDTMAGLVEFRNMETGAHIYHVRQISRILLEDLARRSPQYNLEARLIDLYCHASTMHDIGKIIIPDSILNKPGKLTAEEYAHMKQHTTEGGKIIEGLRLPGQDELKQCCLDVALHHHERWDGKGYPDGLVGDENSIYVQAIGLADVYDALVSIRCYKAAYTFTEATQMILDGRCGVFNPRVLESFLHCQEKIQKEYSATEVLEVTNV